MREKLTVISEVEVISRGYADRSLSFNTRYYLEYKPRRESDFLNVQFEFESDLREFLIYAQGFHVAADDPEFSEKFRTRWEWAYNIIKNANAERQYIFRGYAPEEYTSSIKMAYTQCQLTLDDVHTIERILKFRRAGDDEEMEREMANLPDKARAILLYQLSECDRKNMLFVGHADGWDGWWEKKLTLREASEEYGYHPAALRKAIHANRLVAHKRGKMWFVTRREMAQAIDQKRLQPRER